MKPAWMASRRYSRQRPLRNWMSAAMPSGAGESVATVGSAAVQSRRRPGLLRSCWLCHSVVAGIWLNVRGSRNLAGRSPDTFDLPSDAGEVPAPMAGAQRRRQVQAYPAPAFLNEIKRHSFSFHCWLTHYASRNTISRPITATAESSIPTGAIQGFHSGAPARSSVNP